LHYYIYALSNGYDRPGKDNSVSIVQSEHKRMNTRTLTYNSKQSSNYPCNKYWGRINHHLSTL